MRLLSIGIQGFRSIAQADLVECGALNVLIGKNNSGKSNILSAIQLVFDFLNSASLVATTQPPISNTTDWFQRDGNAPIIISASLQLTETEMEELRNAISGEAPQMKNALDDVSDVTTIECELTFYRNPNLIGYLSRISFGGKPDVPARMIFTLGRDAAEEIAKRDQEARELRRQLIGIARVSAGVDADDWASIRDRSPSSRIPRSRMAPGISDELNSIAVNMVRTAESYEDFKDRLSAYASEVRGRQSSLLSAESETKFGTFSGEAAVVPKYVSMIIGLISGQKLHHLSEQRTPIGTDEANRILRLKTSRGQNQVRNDLQDSVVELLGVQIDAFSGDTPSARTVASSRTATMDAELDVDEFLVQVNGSRYPRSATTDTGL